jgi:hypothetical protein
MDDGRIASEHLRGLAVRQEEEREVHVGSGELDEWILIHFLLFSSLKQASR